MTQVDQDVRPALDYRVEPLDDNTAEWDAFVAADERSSYCHLAGWRRVMGETLGARPCFLRAADREGRTAAVLPLVYVGSPVGRYLVSMPFLNYGGPIGNVVARRALVDEAAALARKRRAGLLELRTRGRAEPPLEEEQRRITVTLPLPAVADELWSAFPSKLRSQVRRPLKAGLQATFGSSEVGSFYDVYARTMRDLGTPALPRTFFVAVAREFADRTIVCVVRRSDGRAAAAGFGFLWRDEVEITWAGALREHSADAPNMLLYWSFMEESIRRGATRFNFGRCRAGGGTHRFKLQWGGADEPLPWSVWRQGTHAPSPEHAGFGLASRVWRRMPLPVANTVGPMLARWLP